MCIICQKGQDPKEYKGLKTLNCNGCTLLTTIPVIAGLERLYCWNCTSLTTLPQIERLTPHYSGCPFLDKNPDCSDNLAKLRLLQGWFRRLPLCRKIAALAQSEEFGRIYYHPDCKGTWVTFLISNDRLRKML